MIVVENLIKDFGDVRAVDGLSFEVIEGEILGFLGPNGAGKTTTMRVLTCYYPPTQGRANVAGFDVVKEPDEVRRVIGYMPEGVPLYREMSVASFLGFIAESKGYPGSRRKALVDAAMEETGLTDVRNRLIAHLSKGFRQRVGLAQAVLGEPKVLILDEPTSGLDPRQIAEVRKLIRAMKGRRTIILSTHILPEVQMTCSRVLIINRGRIAASGTPEKLTSRIQNRFQTVARIIGPPDEVPRVLGAVSGVLQVERTQGHRSGQARGWPNEYTDYTVVSGIDAPDVRPELAKAVISRGWQLVELREVGFTLEDIFMQVVTGESGTGVSPGSQESGSNVA
jgi:ABC-2 type transport system ATP-binding protein